MTSCRASVEVRPARRRRAARARLIAAGCTALLAACAGPLSAQSSAPATTQEDTAAPARAPKHAPDVVFVPTPPAVVAAMLDMAQVSANDVVYDLGSGDGRIVLAAVRDRGARGVGYEVRPELLDQARESAAKEGLTDRAEFREGDLFEADLSPATVVTLYLLPALNLRLMPKLVQELKPGTRIVSHAFDMGDWKPDETRQVEGRSIYLWRIPPQAEAR